MNLKKLLVFTLISCMLFSTTVQASSDFNSSIADDYSCDDTLVWYGTLNHGYYGDISAKFYVKSDVEIDTYMCMKNVDDVTTKCGFLFVSDTPTTVTTYLMTNYGKNNGGWINYTGNTIFDLNNDATSLFAWYDSEKGHDYWLSYLSQFGITEDNYEEFRTWCKGKYVFYSENTINLSDDTVECPILEITESETAIEDKIVSMRVCNPNSLTTWEGKGFFDGHYFVPFVYGNVFVDPNKKPEGNSEQFICYIDVQDYMHGLTLTNKNRFYWDVSRYPKFKDCYIELRVSDLGHPKLGYFWFSSIDSSNKNEEQEFFTLFKFSDGECIVYDYICDDYFQNIFEKFSEIFAPYNSGNYRFQLRVISMDKTLYTDWITFDLDDMKTEYTSSIYDDENNLVDDNIYDNDDYDKVFDDENKKGNSDWRDTENPTVLDNADISDSIFGYFNSFFTWVSNSLNTVKSFSALLTVTYGWLPKDIVTVLGASLVIIVLARVLGR